MEKRTKEGRKGILPWKKKETDAGGGGRKSDRKPIKDWRRSQGRKEKKKETKERKGGGEDRGEGGCHCCPPHIHLDK